MHDLFLAKQIQSQFCITRERKWNWKFGKLMIFFFSETKHTVRNEGKKIKEKRKTTNSLLAEASSLVAWTPALLLRESATISAIFLFFVTLCFVLLQINNNNNNKRLFGVFSFSCSFFSSLFFLPFFFLRNFIFTPRL